MQVLAHSLRLGHRGDGVGAHVLGMRTGEAHTPDARHRGNRTQQFSEQRPNANVIGPIATLRESQIASVAVDVLAEQGDLGDALRGEHADFGDDIYEWAADLDATNGWHDAERA